MEKVRPREAKEINAGSKWRVNPSPCPVLRFRSTLPLLGLCFMYHLLTLPGTQELYQPSLTDENLRFREVKQIF